MNFQLKARKASNPGAAVSLSRKSLAALNHESVRIEVDDTDNNNNNNNTLLILEENQEEACRILKR
jgi:hypothetical protein